MAITDNLRKLLLLLDVPAGSTLLEIGEANWYGEADPPIETTDLFAAAKAFYRDWFRPSRNVAIDWNGTPEALRLDLNQPIDLGEQFDVVINHGTAEHIFNIAAVFKTIHDHCEDGGLMIHDAPFTGWIDHGFYCLQPTLFFDLAHVNCYEVVRVAIHTVGGDILSVNGREHMAALALSGSMPANANLFVALRKYGCQPFRVPMQGYYAGTLSAAAVNAWENAR